MITKMTKYSMILLRSAAACEDESRRMSELISRCRSAVDSLRNFSKEHPDIQPETHPEITGMQMLSDYERNSARRDEISAELSSLGKEYQNALPWRPSVGRIQPRRPGAYRESRSRASFLLRG